MKLKRFIKLKNLSEIILKKNKYNPNILAIRQLQIMRPHPVFLKDYDNSYNDEEKKIDTKNIFTKIFELFLNLFKENELYYTDNKFSNKNFEKKILFLSHLINSKHLKNNDDFYFGDLINYLKKNKYITCNVLRNFTEINSKNIYYKNKKFFETNIILSKSVNLFEEIILVFKIFVTFIKLKKLKLTGKLEKEFFRNLNVFKFSGSAYNNLKLVFQFDKILAKYNPKFLFLTFEGHSWERLIINHVKKKFPKIIILSYQFSVLTKHSSSIYLNLGKNFKPDIILTSGNFTKNKFKKNLDPKITYINIGSNKFNPISQKSSKNSDVLIIPEGFKSETIKMLILSISAASYFKDKKFIFRFHPMIDQKLFFENLSTDKKQIPKNLIFSNKTFQNDINRTKYVIYRGSAASIQALSFGKVPIYYELQGEINIDPLFMLKNKFYIKNVTELEKVFKDPLLKNKNKKNIFFTKEYFDKPNFTSLIKYLNKL